MRPSALPATVIEKSTKEDPLVFIGLLGKSGPGGAKVRFAKGDVTATLCSLACGDEGARSLMT